LQAAVLAMVLLVVATMELVSAMPTSLVTESAMLSISFLPMDWATLSISFSSSTVSAFFLASFSFSWATLSASESAICVASAKPWLPASPQMKPVRQRA
jgi:hypothetical protein